MRDDPPSHGYGGQAGLLRGEKTLIGRFDLVALHAWLVLERLQSRKAESQALIDEIFLAFDEALRDIGTGDAGMHRRLKTMASVFYGRLQAYRGAQDLEELAEAIWRNLYRGAKNCRSEARAMATYAWNAHSHLASSDLMQDRLEFGPLPSM